MPEKPLMSDVGELKDLVKNVMDTGYLMSLATSDQRGVWVSDLVYIADDQLNLYWISRTNTRHSRAIAVNPLVAGSITASQHFHQDAVGIQFSGMAAMVEGISDSLLDQYIEKRGGREHFSSSELIVDGRSWFKLKPTHIEILDESKFGRGKQVLDLRVGG